MNHQERLRIAYSMFVLLRRTVCDITRSPEYLERVDPDLVSLSCDLVEEFADGIGRPLEVFDNIGLCPIDQCERTELLRLIDLLIDVSRSGKGVQVKNLGDSHWGHVQRRANDIATRYNYWTPVNFEDFELTHS